MTQQGKQANNMQNATEPRLRVATPGTGQPAASRLPRRLPQTRFSPQSVPVKLFLVKGNKVRQMSRSLDTAEPGHVAHPQWRHSYPLPEAPGRIVEMPVHAGSGVNPKVEERVIGLLALAGPLAWLGHVLMSWMR